MGTDGHVPIVSAVIVSFNTCELTIQCLRDFCRDTAESIATEVFVVDNGSADGTADAVRGAFPAVTVIDVGRNAGFGPANNLAFKQATGKFVLLLNTDAFVRPGAIAAMVDYLRRHPGTAVVGPRVLNADGSLQLSCYKFPSPWRAAFDYLLLTAAFPNHPRVGDYRAWPHNAEREVDFVIGACMLVRRAAIDQVGGFDESFFMYAEETDWCRRFHDAGWSVGFTPEAEVVHLNGGSGKAQSDRVFNEFRRGTERYIRKYHGVSGLWFFRLMVVIGACLRIGLFGVRGLLPGGAAARKLVRLWARILSWNIGFRGEGLSGA